MLKRSLCGATLCYRHYRLKIACAMTSLLSMAAASVNAAHFNDGALLTAYVPVALQLPSGSGNEVHTLVFVGSFQSASDVDEKAVLAQKSDQPHPDVQGLDFLDKFRSPSLTVIGKGGSRVFLWSKMLVAEDPDFDPLQYLDEISVEWNQVEGPQIAIEEMTSRSAFVSLPFVTIRTRIEFLCTISNPHGSRRLSLKIDVLP